MCHSSGGFILKQGLCIANVQSEKYGMVFSSILGITFLRVPHAMTPPGTLMERSLLILNQWRVISPSKRISALKRKRSASQISQTYFKTSNYAPR